MEVNFDHKKNKIYFLRKGKGRKSNSHKITETPLSSLFGLCHWLLQQNAFQNIFPSKYITFFCVFLVIFRLVFMFLFFCFRHKIDVMFYLLKCYQLSYKILCEFGVILIKMGNYGVDYFVKSILEQYLHWLFFSACRGFFWGKSVKVKVKI